MTESFVDLSLYQERLDGICWWCGAAADSREHRHKRTDLLRLWSGSEGPVWGGDGGRTESIRGPNSKSSTVRFGRVLCQHCNNDRSQPFDLAYEQFSDALVDGMDDWWRAPEINFESLFGADWPTASLNVARYYVKNFGCEMADHGVRPPSTMAEFLDGAGSMTDVRLSLVKSASHYSAHRSLRRLGPNAALFRPADLVWFSRSRKRFIGYEGMALVGYVGVLLQWQEGTGPRDSFFFHPHPAIEKITAAPDTPGRGLLASGGPRGPDPRSLGGG